MASTAPSPKPPPTPPRWCAVSRGRPFPLILLIHLSTFLFCLPIYLITVVWNADRVPWLSCGFKDLTGVPCPSCGFTRSFLWMGRGEWSRAFHNSPFSACLYLAMLIFMAVNLATVLLRVQIKPGTAFHWKKRGWLTFIVTVLSLLIADWIYRCYHGLQ